MENVAFCACSFIRSASGRRARMVERTFRSWCDFLQLPFREKLFLDDQSPNFAALHLLQKSGALSSFTEVRYQTLAHTPHSNFGIVACLEMASTPYIVHLDDDVFVTTSASECLSYIQGMIDVMERDSSILGGNLITMDPAFHREEWLPGEPYKQNPAWSHPRKLFGTGACVLRRELLQRVPFSRILEWNSNQPAFWEVLVSHTPREFITGPLDTPFDSVRTAFFDSSTAQRTLRDRFFYHYGELKRRNPRLAAAMAWRKKIFRPRERKQS